MFVTLAPEIRSEPERVRESFGSTAAGATEGEQQQGKDFQAPVGNFCHIWDDLIDFPDRCLQQTKSNQHAEGKREMERVRERKVRVSGKVGGGDKKTPQKTS